MSANPTPLAPITQQSQPPAATPPDPSTTPQPAPPVPVITYQTVNDKYTRHYMAIDAIPGHNAKWRDMFLDKLPPPLPANTPQADLLAWNAALDARIDYLYVALEILSKTKHQRDIGMALDELLRRTSPNGQARDNYLSQTHLNQLKSDMFARLDALPKSAPAPTAAENAEAVKMAVLPEVTTANENLGRIERKLDDLHKPASQPAPAAPQPPSPPQPDGKKKEDTGKEEAWKSPLQVAAGILLAIAAAVAAFVYVM